MSPKSFAVIPAAGLSRRTGNVHKLLLPWHPTNVISAVLTAWSNSRADRIAVVTRPVDHELHRFCRDVPRVELVVATSDPEDMKRSVQLGLEHFAKSSPSPTDRWLLAPADLPTLATSTINQVIDASAGSREVIVPSYGGRRGHPVSIPWRLAAEIGQLAADEGIDRLLKRHPSRWLDLDVDQYPRDIDTLEEYNERLREGHPDSPD